MCATKMPPAPGPIAAPPPAPTPVAQILMPSKARIRSRSTAGDVLSSLRIPLRLPNPATSGVQ